MDLHQNVLIAIGVVLGVLLAFVIGKLVVISKSILSVRDKYKKAKDRECKGTHSWDEYGGKNTVKTVVRYL